MAATAAAASTDSLRMAVAEFPPVTVDMWRVSPPGGNQIAFTEVAVSKAAPANTGVDPPHSAKIRIVKLERSLNWLQEQHSKMLADLHAEIENIKNKNRELQFKLTMSGVEDFPKEEEPSKVERGRERKERESRQTVQLVEETSKRLEANKLLDTSPLQVEILNNEIKTLQGSLLEARSRNLYLENIVETQRRKLQELEKEEAEEEEKLVGTRLKTPNCEVVDRPPSEELMGKLAEAQRMLARLEEENQTQREELEEIRLNMAREVRLKFRGCNHPAKLRQLAGFPPPSRSSSTNRINTYPTARFPPLKPVSVSPRRARLV